MNSNIKDFGEEKVAKINRKLTRKLMTAGMRKLYIKLNMKQLQVSSSKIIRSSNRKWKKEDKSKQQKGKN